MGDRPKRLVVRPSAVVYQRFITSSASFNPCCRTCRGTPSSARVVPGQHLPVGRPR